MVDRVLVLRQKKLAERLQVVPDLDKHLALISPSQNLDKFYVLQGLEETKTRGASRFYSFQRWGATGDIGQYKLDGPKTLEDITKILSKVFKQKTGVDMDTLKPGDRVTPGKYWLPERSQADVEAKWQYYVNDHVDGKATGWYDYVPDASDQVEELYAQHVANEREERTNTRVVKSGHFSYKIDLADMKQQNTKTGITRIIRRTMGRSS